MFKMSADYVCQISSLGASLKKFHLVNVGTFALCLSSKLALFSVSDLKDEKMIKKQIYMKTETCKLYPRVF